jgi:sulfatase maturation enzyme AslB (radical SAM superfamily)
MTSVPPRVLKMWEEFKQIRVGCSIDGMGDMLEYQRWPIKWKQAKANLEKIDNLPNNIIAWIAFTVTAYNIFHLPEFMMWKLKESGYKKINSSSTKPVITHHVAHGPKRANIRILNKELKQDVHEHYNYYKDKLAKDPTIDDKVKKKFNLILDSVTKYMDADDWSEKIPEFIKFTKYLDQERKQNILMVTPQYKELFD